VFNFHQFYIIIKEEELVGEEIIKLCRNCKFGGFDQTVTEPCKTCFPKHHDNPDNWRDAYWQPREAEENKPKEKVRFNFTKGISNKKEDN
jgi:hypothetical protein